MKLSLRLYSPTRVIDLGEFDANDGVIGTFEVDGAELFSIDLWYAVGGKGEGRDPSPEAPGEPHINLAIEDWPERPEDSEYVVIAHLAIPKSDSGGST